MRARARRRPCLTAHHKCTRNHTQCGVLTRARETERRADGRAWRLERASSHAVLSSVGTQSVLHVATCGEGAERQRKVGAQRRHPRTRPPTGQA